MRKLALVLMALALSLPAAGAEYAPLPASRFNSVMPAGLTPDPVAVAAFRMRTEPVTNGEFLAFVHQYPEWRRDRVAKVFADARYLTHWQGAARLGDAILARQPVTRVSWFAAQAFCESEGARLPTWHEWEYAAAADATRADARSDPAWRERILAWYGRPSSQPLPEIGGEANVFGVRDLNGLVWEWVEDFNALLVASDSREQNGADKLKFCGAGALSMQEKENYATLMRIAMLSALDARDTTNNLGFRCVKPETRN